MKEHVGSCMYRMVYCFDEDCEIRERYHCSIYDWEDKIVFLRLHESRESPSNEPCHSCQWEEIPS